MLINLGKIRERMEQAIAERIFPGCAFGAVVGGQKHFITLGKHTYKPDSPQVTKDSVFDVASVTKSVPTASLALFLIDNGKLGLYDKVIEYVPELQNAHREDVTIWHLLTHTLDFGEMYLSRQKDKSPQEILQFIFSREFFSKPGEKYWYMNATSVLLGLVIERVAGKPLDVLADEIFFHPLKMTRTTFRPSVFERSEVVPTEEDEWRGGLVHGSVHDESAYILQKSFIPGHAGLFSTASDLLIFLQMLLEGGRHEGKTFFSKKILARMFTNQLEALGESAGLGWELNQQFFMGGKALEHTFGKTGFTGCVVVGDIDKKIAYCLLSNAVHPKRDANRDPLNQVRRDIAELIL